MKKILAFTTALALLMSCQDKPKEVPTWTFGDDDTEEPADPSTPDPSINDPGREALMEYTDMVLLYGGGHHRNPYHWNKEIAADYVAWNKADGTAQWLFDSFLLLEFMDPATAGGAGHTFITGYQYNGSYMPSATKEDWQMLIDYYFTENAAIDAIEQAVAQAAKTMGEPPSKRKIIIGIPEPIVYQYSATNTGSTAYWGEVDGKALDFAAVNDRIKAIKWYIDALRAKFYAKEWKYVDLAGFYWVAEKSTHTSDIIGSIASYLSGMNYTFNWIPYFKAEGYNRWSQFGFTRAYLQPNYFFSTDVPYARLTEACDLALQYNMGMEVEFDGNAQAAYGRGYRLRDYMTVFKAKGIWEKCRLAYYQGAWAVRWLKNSSNAEDRQLFEEFADFVTSRPIRNQE
ncbi:MAG: DUF4855 domain-containing protein [Bacteroidales bacterium]|nr:DUF4855 domain-containing protein [Bacteroidales bacterium]